LKDLNVAIIERQTSGIKSTYPGLLIGRVFPHALIICHMLYQVSASFSTASNHLWVFIAGYTLFSAGHTWMAYKRFRVWIVAAVTLVAATTLAFVLRLSAPHTESGMYTANVVGVFLAVLIWFSALTNTMFFRWKLYHWFELLLIGLIWTAIVLVQLEKEILTILFLSLPILLYMLYVLVFGYAYGKPLDGSGKRKVFLRALSVMLALLLAFVIWLIVGVGFRDETLSASYSLLSKKNDRYTVEDKAKLEDEFKVPLDSKELVLVANIDPIAGQNIGYYLKFHSLYNYDSQKGEFNTRSDEMEDPRFHVRRVPLSSTLGEPAHLLIGMDGREIMPPYSYRADGKSTLYNVKLDMEQSFGHNLTYRFVSYPARDSIAVAGVTYPILGVFRLFSKISVMNVYPLGVGGRRYDELLLSGVDRFASVDDTPLSFKQQYLNTTGLEPDVEAMFRQKLKGCTTTAQKLRAVIAFFNQRTGDGRQLFMYDLKPGRPMPGETRLHHFLMSSHRGYCTYYATAAALFLRAAGIPSRVAIGFAPDRGSEQNPGWYFIYTFQGHAWTETYMGERLGWIDLDVTPAGSESGQAAPPPDPTPPLPPMPLEPQIQLIGTLAAKGEEPLCRRTLVRWKDEARDSVICASPSASPVRLVQDTGYKSKGENGIISFREAMKTAMEGLQVGDSIMALGRATTNQSVRSCSFNEFCFYRVSKLARKTDEGNVEPPNKDTGSAWWKNPVLFLVVGLFLLIDLLMLPRIHLTLLRKRMLYARNEGRRLELTRSWVFMKLHLNGMPIARETDFEYAARLYAKHGFDMRVFLDEYLRYRYYDSVTGLQQPVCRRIMSETDAYIRNKRGMARGFLASMNLWQYIRYLNRRHTI
jgi:hypothetical protein